MKNVVIIGAGGHGRVVLDILRADNKFQPIGFIDADIHLQDQKIDGLPILGDINILPKLKKQNITHFIVAIGDSKIRRRYAEQVIELDLELINAIHPSANIASTATLGDNIVIAAGALVCAHCTIGNSAILNTGCIIDHETTIASAAHVCPGAKLAGRVTVEPNAFIGIGATVIQNIKIAADAIIGAGAVVIRDVQPGSTVIGVPARPINLPMASAESALNKLEELLEEVTI